MVEFLNKVFGFAFIAFFGWFGISYLDIVLNNLNGANYHSWNLITKVILGN